VDKPQDLGTRGEALWDNVTAEREFDAAGYALLEDACRTSDIIANLTHMLNSDEDDWLRIIEDRGGEGRLTLNIAPLLGEIRQQRLAMNRLMNQLGIGRLSGGGDTESKAAKDFWAAKEEEFEKG
jgi:hypothetical protein